MRRSPGTGLLAAGLVALGVLAFAPAASAQIAAMVNSIPDAFNAVQGMEAPLQVIALSVCGGLVAIEVAFSLGFLWVNGQASLQAILGEILKQGLMIGFWAFAIQIGPSFCRSIILSMVQAGNTASQAIGGSANMSPGDVIGIGMNMVGTIWSAVSWSPKTLVLVLCGAIIIWTFAEITCAVIEVTVEGYLFSSWAALMMGFGGNSYTRDIAIAQFRLALSIGAKRFVLQCLIGLGEALIHKWAAGLSNGSLSYTNCVSMVVVSIIVWRLAKTIPQRAQDMIAGVHTGAGYVGAGGLAQSGVNAATSAATGTGAMGMAAGAAYALAKEQLAATSGGGGTSGGSRLATGAKLAMLTAGNMGQAAATDYGNRLAGQYSASHGYTGARMARISRAAASEIHDGAANANTRAPQAAPSSQNNP